MDTNADSQACHTCGVKDCQSEQVCCQGLEGKRALHREVALDLDLGSNPGGAGKREAGQGFEGGVELGACGEGSKASEVTRYWDSNFQLPKRGAAGGETAAFGSATVAGQSCAHIE